MQFSFSNPDLEKLAQIVREITGNNIQEKNFSMIASRIRCHMSQLKIENMDSYWQYFENNEVQERLVLQSLMTTHHTFFFREKVHFDLLEKWVDERSEVLIERYRKTGQPFKVWSAACSRGQEVYSLAMFLEFSLFKKYGVPFEVVGTDIDAESVAYARNGVYPIKEVNAIPTFYLNGYWKKGTANIKDFAAVHPNLKSRTRFEVLNLLEIKNSPLNEKFDVVFCRNLFIYFSEENIIKIANSLVGRMEANGLFVSGISEPLRFSGWKHKMFGPSSYEIGSFQKAIPKTNTLLPVVPAVKLPPAAYAVLCVDDSSTIQMMMKRIFSHDKDCVKVDFAFNGREAREKLNAGKYDIITLDIHMPEVNGIEFLEKHYDVKKDPPVLMVTSVDRTDVSLASKSLSLGAFDYVEKPEMNNLRKSVDEILMKVKLAIKQKDAKAMGHVSQFDQSISRRIVVPDASQCIRIVVGSSAKSRQLEHMIKGQEDESRSPATLIVWKDQDELKTIQKNFVNWTKKNLTVVVEPGALLRPNNYYLIKSSDAPAFIKNLQFKTLSLQMLDHLACPFVRSKAANVQILFDESLSSHVNLFEKQNNVLVSDVTPSTSFPSLSVEFFANLRKSAA